MNDLNDSQLLRDLEYLTNNLENTFNGLLSQARHLHEEAQNQELIIRDLIKDHQNNLEQISCSLEKIGGSKELKTLIDKIQTTHELFSQYPNIDNKIQQQLSQCSIATESLSKAYDNVEDLQSFCNELLDIREFLQGVSGFSKLYNSIEEVTNLIRDFRQQQEDFEARWITRYNQGTNLLTQLQQSQESGHDLVTEYQHLNQKVMRLEQSIIYQEDQLEKSSSSLNKLNEQVNTTHSKITQLEQKYQQHITENIGSQQQLTLEINNLKNIDNKHETALEMNKKGLDDLENKVEIFEKFKKEIGKKTIILCLLGGVVGSFITSSMFLVWILPTFANRISEPSQSLIKTN